MEYAEPALKFYAKEIFSKFIAWFLMHKLKFYFLNKINSPIRVYTIYYWVVHGVAHRQPIDTKIDFLYMSIRIYRWIVCCHNEVNVLGKPADGENQYYNYHH